MHAATASASGAVPVRRLASRLCRRALRHSHRRRRESWHWQRRPRHSGAQRMGGLSAPCTSTTPPPAWTLLGSRPHPSSSLARPAPRSQTPTSSSRAFRLQPLRLSRLIRRAPMPMCRTCRAQPQPRHLLHHVQALAAAFWPSASRWPASQWTRQRAAMATTLAYGARPRSGSRTALTRSEERRVGKECLL